MSELPPEIHRHYVDEIDEDARIRSGLGELELVRTRDILRRHLRPAPLRIADVGGATGVHSEWLLADGHEVILVEPVAEQVDRAVEELGAHPRFRAEVGNALVLPFDDASCDAVLLMGPLYHLTDRTQRLAALREAVRVARPGGLVAGAAISRFASLLDGLQREFLFDPDFRAIVAGALGSGQHRNPTQRSGWFTTAYFHHPDDLAEEAQDAGVEDVSVVGVEGPPGLFANLESRWADPADRAVILETAAAVETESTLLGASPHLLVLGRAPAND